MTVQIEMPQGFVPCVFCGQPNPEARLEIGKKHCMDDECVGEWRRRRIETEDLALVFVHKQGLMWIKREDVPKNDIKRQGGS